MAKKKKIDARVVKVKVIPVDAKIYEVELPHETAFTEIRKLVGGDIQLYPKTSYAVDEDGYTKNLPVNTRVNQALASAKGLISGVVVGTVVEILEPRDRVALFGH